jgi:CheY-like chemotaxis protein
MSTVLVVDDEFGIAELMLDILTDEGHRVVTAANGRQGLEVLARERPSLVFLDYMMPVLDGAGMLRGMAEDASLNGVPVVMISSIPEATVAERCRGYSAFMRKPFRIAEVITITERLLERFQRDCP